MQFSAHCPHACACTILPVPMGECARFTLTSQRVGGLAMRFNMSAPRGALLIAMSFALALPRAVFSQAAVGPSGLHAFAVGGAGLYPIGPLGRDRHGTRYVATDEGGAESPH